MDNLRSKAFNGAIKGLLMQALVIFLPAWTFYYWQAWVYLAIYTTATFGLTAYFLEKDPALMERRLRVGLGRKKRKTSGSSRGWPVCLH